MSSAEEDFYDRQQDLRDDAAVGRSMRIPVTITVTGNNGAYTATGAGAVCEEESGSAAEAVGKLVLANPTAFRIKIEDLS